MPHVGSYACDTALCTLSHWSAAKHTTSAATQLHGVLFLLAHRWGLRHAHQHPGSSSSSLGRCRSLLQVFAGPLALLAAEPAGVRVNA
jgi:hypothetical protein